MNTDGQCHQNGYSIQYTPFHPSDPTREPIHCMVYIGMPDNPQFQGALNPQDVATKINESIGPSVSFSTFKTPYLWFETFTDGIPG